MRKPNLQPRFHHRGRLTQVPIYFGKMLRSFLYMSDWKMLPMAAVIAALISMVVRRDFFVTMEGTTKGAFSLICVAIWNGCFNSIQVICRERPIIKREHRSGMHVVSYVVSHMLYQALLCLAQSVITVIVCKTVGVQFIEKGVITGIGIVDVAITVFFVTYASDMISLFISSVAHTTTSAMTVMPFVLIFQLVFSGGIFALPAWTDSISTFTISKYGMECITSQADYNNLPMVTGWTTLLKVQDRQISGSITIGKLLDIADENGMLSESRDFMLIDKDTLMASLGSVGSSAESPTEFVENVSGIATVLDSSPETDKGLEIANRLAAAAEAHDGLTLGDLVDAVSDTELIQQIRDTEIPYNFTVRSLIDSFGRDKLESTIKSATAAAMQNEKYENSAEHIAVCWYRLTLFAAFFALCTMISLKFIDKDKR